MKKIIISSFSFFILFVLFVSSISTVHAATTLELQSQISSLQQQLQSLQSQINKKLPTSSIPTISSDLFLGNSGNAVRDLQRALNFLGIKVSVSGAGSPGQESNYYGQKTANAVKRFQDQYSSTILAPLGLTHGTGYFGVSTRAMMNSLISTKASTKPIKETETNTAISSTGVIVVDPPVKSNFKKPSVTVANTSTVANGCLIPDSADSQGNIASINVGHTGQNNLLLPNKFYYNPQTWYRDHGMYSSFYPVGRYFDGKYDSSFRDIFNHRFYDLFTEHTDNYIKEFQMWNTKNGTANIELRLLSGQADDSNNLFGYYSNGNLSTFTPIFKTGSNPDYTAPELKQGNTKAFTILNVRDTIEFALLSQQPSLDNKIDQSTSFVSTENLKNVDKYDHVIVYNPSKNTYILIFQPEISNMTDWWHYPGFAVELKVTGCKAPKLLVGSCSVNRTNALVGQPVTFSADATGGTGDYTYSWTGTDGVSGTTKSITKEYADMDEKTATVTITSGNQSTTKSCQVNYDNHTPASDKPVIDDVAPLNVKYEGTVTIKGKNFGTPNTRLIVNTYTEASTFFTIVDDNTITFPFDDTLLGQSSERLSNLPDYVKDNIPKNIPFSVSVRTPAGASEAVEFYYSRW